MVLKRSPCQMSMGRFLFQEAYRKPYDQPREAISINPRISCSLAPKAPKICPPAILGLFIGASAKGAFHLFLRIGQRDELMHVQSFIRNCPLNDSMCPLYGGFLGPHEVKLDHATSNPALMSGRRELPATRHQATPPPGQPRRPLPQRPAMARRCGH